MKTILCLLLLINTYAFSQCPESGLKIQSKECQDPKALVVTAAVCKEMKVKWIGNKGQAYVVNATYQSLDNVVNAKVSEVANDNGNCTATIIVDESANINWSVQAVCNIKGAKVYSAPVNGAETYIPACNADKRGDAPKSFSVFPNPTNGLLTVECSGSFEKNVVLNVYDMSGKKVFTQNQKSLAGNTNQYKLNLHELPPGAYTLEMINGVETKQTKFVVVGE